MESVLYKRHQKFIHLFCGSSGEIYSLKKSRFLTIKPNPDGYVQLTLKNRRVFSHRLICETFNGQSNGKEVNHINSIRSDNRSENLEWVTKSENTKHSFLHGFNSQKGERNARSKLTMGDVEKIRKLRGCGMSYVSISKLYPVTPETISNICRAKSWV